VLRTLPVVLAFAAALYVGLALMLYFLQERMVFLPQLPGRALDATPQAIGLDYEDAFIDTADGERLHGWFVPAANARGTLLFFHGNAGNISHRLDSIAIFNRLGLDVLIVDYRGYGQSTGSPSEAGTYRDARAAWDWLLARGVVPERIVVFGRSLGGAVGAWLAAQPDVRPAGLIVESCFTSGADMARRLYPWLPARWITRLKYPARDYVAAAEAPVMVIHSRDDEIIPFDMGRALHDAAPSPRTFFELRGDHNAGFWLSRDRYAPALNTFFAESLGSEQIL